MLRLLILVSVLVAGVALSCGAGGDDTPQVASGPGEATTDVAPPLEGTSWEFVEIEGEPVVRFENEEAPQIRLIAADQTITASLSCNLFKGTYEVEDESLRLQLTPVSWRECQASHEQEELLRRVIQAATGYRIEDDRLLLLEESRIIAVLTPMAQP